MSTQVPNEIISSNSGNFTLDELKKFTLDHITEHLSVSGVQVNFTIPDTPENLVLIPKLKEYIEKLHYRFETGQASRIENEHSKEVPIIWFNIYFT